jgi:hypothetical protein
LGKGFGKLRPTFECISTFACLDLYQYGNELKALRSGKAGEGVPLGFYAKPGAALR